MISTCSSVLVVIILATSILVSVFYEISTASSTNVAAVTPPISKSNKVAVDKFGIREIYPTDSNGGIQGSSIEAPLYTNRFAEFAF